MLHDAEQADRADAKRAAGECLVTVVRVGQCGQHRRRRWRGVEELATAGQLACTCAVTEQSVVAAPQRERTIGCSANLRLIGEKRARRGHAPGIIGSNTAGAGAHTATSTDGGRSTVRAAASAGAHTDACAAGRGPVARATDSSISSSTDGSDTIIPLTIILLTGTNAG
jgi:hypothetical protein